MSPLDDQSRHAQVALLKPLRDKGRLTSDEYHAELLALSVDPQTVFDQREHVIEKQINVAGDLYQLAPQPGASSDELRKHYLHRLVQRVSNLPPDGVASDVRGSELQLSSEYTALMTQQPEMGRLFEAVCPASM